MPSTKTTTSPLETPPLRVRAATPFAAEKRFSTSRLPSAWTCSTRCASTASSPTRRAWTRWRRWRRRTPRSPGTRTSATPRRTASASAPTPRTECTSRPETTPGCGAGRSPRVPSRTDTARQALVRIYRKTRGSAPSAWTRASAARWRLVWRRASPRRTGLCFCTCARRTCLSTTLWRRRRRVWRGWSVRGWRTWSAGV